MRREYGHVEHVEVVTRTICPACDKTPLLMSPPRDPEDVYCTACGTALESRRLRVVVCSCTPNRALSEHLHDRYCGQCGVHATTLLEEHDAEAAHAAMAPPRV